MLSPYRIHPNNTNKRTKKVKNTTFDNDLHRESDVKRPQMTSNENSKKVKGGSIQDNTEINEHYLDKVLKNNST